MLISEPQCRAVVARLRVEVAAEFGTPAKVFVPQTRLPGAEGEVDWGKLDAVIGGETVTFVRLRPATRQGSAGRADRVSGTYSLETSGTGRTPPADVLPRLRVHPVVDDRIPLLALLLNASAHQRSLRINTKGRRAAKAASPTTSDRDPALRSRGYRPRTRRSRGAGKNPASPPRCAPSDS